MEQTNQQSSKRIVKNTGMLYMRMLLIMGVSLYTSRVILEALGIEDFGIYNVVAGFVSMFAFLNNAMATSTNRFLSFELGNGDIRGVKNVFSMSILIHILIALIVLIFSETIGLWFLNNRATIPTDRINAANYVYHFSIITLVINIISVPYTAVIIARERMKAFAWISIVEAFLKLAIVFMLGITTVDKLKLYSILMLAVVIIIKLIYIIYCRKSFEESKFSWFWERTKIKTMTSFAIWNLLGNIAHIALTQGTNVLLNLFFGPIVNAAYGVSFKVRETINQFVVNIQLAIKPQIIKSYAANDFTYTIKLMFMGAKYSFFLLFVITLPLLFEMDTVLNIWLTEVPKYTTDLTKLGIMFIWIECISQSLMSVAQATGKIKLYQAVIGVLMLLNLPISYIFLKFGFEPVITILVSITIAIIALFTRLFLVKRLIYFKIQDYIQNVILKILVIISTGFIVPYLVTTLMEQSILRLFFTIASSTLWSSVCIYFLGLNKKEKKYTLSYMHKYKAKLFF